MVDGRGRRRGSVVVVVVGEVVVVVGLVVVAFRGALVFDSSISWWSSCTTLIELVDVCLVLTQVAVASGRPGSSGESVFACAISACTWLERLSAAAEVAIRFVGVVGV